MASEGSAPAVVANGGEESVAQRLQQHHVTVEDAPDDELSSQAADDASSAVAPGPSAAKTPAKRQQAALDTQSRELFPELGAPRGKSPSVVPIWGARSDANGGSNGVSPSLTPVSGSASPAPLAHVRIPGHSVERMKLDPGHVRPEMRRGLEVLLKKIGKRFNTPITVSTGSNGQLQFQASGPQAVAQQALKDVVAQIGSKVCVQPGFCSLSTNVLCRL